MRTQRRRADVRDAYVRRPSLAPGLSELVTWLTAHGVAATAIEATGVYWQAPWKALTEASIEAQLLNAHQVGLGRPSFISSRQFRDLRCLSRHRRSLVAQRTRVPNQVQRVLDRSGVRIGAVLSDIFGANGWRVLDGLVSRLDREVILASLSGHVRLKVDQLGDALRLELRETDRILLTDLLDEHDTLTRRVSRSIATSTRLWRRTPKRVVCWRPFPASTIRRPAPS